MLFNGIEKSFFCLHYFIHWNSSTFVFHHGFWMSYILSVDENVDPVNHFLPFLTVLKKRLNLHLLVEELMSVIFLKKKRSRAGRLNKPPPFLKSLRSLIFSYYLSVGIVVYIQLMLFSCLLPTNVVSFHHYNIVKN